jgi:hypothetical protein
LRKIDLLDILALAGIAVIVGPLLGWLGWIMLILPEEKARHVKESYRKIM